MMKQIINKKNALRDLTDSQFEMMVSDLASEIAAHGIFYEDYSDAEIMSDWKLLCKKPLPIDKTQTTIAATNVAGMKIMRKYMKHFHSVANYKGISVQSMWTPENLEKALKFNRKNHSTPYASEIIRSLSFTAGLGKVTMYRPLMARNIVSYFNATSVLDVCAGWGGRMLGTKSVLGGSVSYTGVEPCKKTFDGLTNICNELKLENTILVNTTAEKFLNTLPENTKYDLALTSPPYFNLEIYSDEETQSINSKDYKTWIETFLEPVIKGIIQRVTYSCWSVKNFKTDKKYDLFEDVVRIHEENGWKMMDTTFAMANSKRPGNSAGSGIKKTEEITYVFCAV